MKNRRSGTVLPAVPRQAQTLPFAVIAEDGCPIGIHKERQSKSILYDSCTMDNQSAEYHAI